MSHMWTFPVILATFQAKVLQMTGDRQFLRDMQLLAGTGSYAARLKYPIY